MEILIPNAALLLHSGVRGIGWGSFVVLSVKSTMVGKVYSSSSLLGLILFRVRRRNDGRGIKPWRLHLG